MRVRSRVFVVMAITTALGIGACGSDSPTEPSLFRAEDVQVGEGVPAVSGDTLTVNYIGRLDDGRIFDSSYDRNQPFTFRLGAGAVIRGWDQGLVGMRVGGLRRLTIPPALAYGSQGSGPIPPNATLHFDIELVANAGH
jgi:FKBP-type peptidyl-prolyl cis-trans isomerase